MGRLDPSCVNSTGGVPCSGGEPITELPIQLLWAVDVGSFPDIVVPDGHVNVSDGGTWYLSNIDMNGNPIDWAALASVGSVTITSASQDQTSVILSVDVLPDRTEFFCAQPPVPPSRPQDELCTINQP